VAESIKTTQTPPEIKLTRFTTPAAGRAANLAVEASKRVISLVTARRLLLQVLPQRFRSLFKRKM
jgi:hypothetical protein